MHATASRNFAFNALMDPEIDLVTLLGTAGTGKTLLALAAGLAQDHGRAALTARSS
jgi:PhoH-like ATPase